MVRNRDAVSIRAAPRAALFYCGDRSPSEYQCGPGTLANRCSLPPDKRAVRIARRLESRSAPTGWILPPVFSGSLSLSSRLKGRVQTLLSGIRRRLSGARPAIPRLCGCGRWPRLRA